MLELPTFIEVIHPFFHISLLKKCVGHPTLIIPLKSVVVKDSLINKEVLVEILEHLVHGFINKKVTSLKVLWTSQSEDGAAWEVDAYMTARYSHLFPSNFIQLEVIVPLQCLILLMCN